jgi:asparagine synthase (glutamine-hydrolysing)
MCGIAGIVGLKGSPVSMIEDRLKRMGTMLGHRGPDQEGVYISNDRMVGIFNNRLAIVGISSKIRLPMRSQDNNYLLSFNGEIYNHNNLRKQLILEGCNFISHTDTEVLHNGLISHGIDYLQHLDGMWGFAFIDQNKKNIHLSRDVLGEKPLYYYIGESELIFCSEVAPILAVMKNEPEWEDEAIVCSFQYRSAPPGKTLIKGVYRLHGGETLTVDYKHNNIHSSYCKRLNVERWKWFFDTNPSLDEVVDLYTQEINSSCNLRFPSEVGFVTTLSGGIDSTLINLMLSKYGNQKIEAIHGISSFISPKRGNDLSELEAARYTSRKLNIDLLEFFMYDEESLIIHQQEASDCFDGIFCEGVSSFRILAKQARLLGKKVLVLSDGPDELLNGYNVDLITNKINTRTQKFSDEKRLCIQEAALARSSWSGKSQGFMNWAYLNSMPSATRPNHGGTSTNIMSELISESYKDTAFKKYGISRKDELMSYHDLDTLQRISLGYLQSSLPDYVNTRSDRGAMKESIEARLPFLSVPMVELAMSTPKEFRIDKEGMGKRILRELVEKHIGKSVSKRGKYGFADPFWMIPGNRDKIGMDDIINSSPIFKEGLFKTTAKKTIFKPGNERLVWMAYSLAMTEKRLKKIRSKIC